MKIKQILITVLISTLVGLSVWIIKPSETSIKYPFPYIDKVDPALGLSCEAIVGSTMYGGYKKDDKIEAKVFKGTDKIAVKLKEDNKFSFLTRASLEAGETDSSENWVLVKNDDKFLIASLSDFDENVPIQNFADMFYLNKENGIGLWVKTSSDGIGSSTPETQSYLLHCM